MHSQQLAIVYFVGPMFDGPTCENTSSIFQNDVRIIAFTFDQNNIMYEDYFVDSIFEYIDGVFYFRQLII
jgi:hypothetical protein